MKTKSLNRHPKTLKEVSDAIQLKHPHVCLTRGEGYYYLYSDDEQTALMLAGMYQTSVHINNFRWMTLQQWVDDVDRLFADPRNVKDEIPHPHHKAKTVATYINMNIEKKLEQECPFCQGYTLVPQCGECRGTGKIPRKDSSAEEIAIQIFREKTGIYTPDHIECIVAAMEEHTRLKVAASERLRMMDAASAINEANLLREQLAGLKRESEWLDIIDLLRKEIAKQKETISKLNEIALQKVEDKLNGLKELLDMGKLKEENDRFREVLVKVSNWELPETGQKWDDDTPMSYEACYGTNGSRDYFKELSFNALNFSKSSE